MAASVCSSSTGAVTGTDPAFVLTQRVNNSVGVVLLVQYTRTAAQDLTITLETFNPSIHPTAIATGAGLAIGSTTTKVSNIAFYYAIAGAVYNKAANAVGTAPGTDVIVATKYGAVAFDIDRAGTIFAIPATDQVAQEFTSAALAAAALPAVASDRVRMGYVTASKSDDTFTFGTTALSAANTTVAYTSVGASTYKLIALDGTALSAYTVVISATGNYQIPINLSQSEKIVIANLTVGGAAAGNTIVANISEV